MIARIDRAKSGSERFDFVSDFVAQAINQSDSAPGEVLKWSLQMDLQRIINRDYETAISSLCQSVHETQSAAAYLLLAEAHSQAGQIDMALVTVDVLKYVFPELPEADMMKGLLLREKGDHAEARKCLQDAVKEQPTLRIAWKELIDMALDQGKTYEAARLLNEALKHGDRNSHLARIQGSLTEVQSAC